MSSTASPWSGRSHAELAELARELLMAGHLIDRSGMPHLIGRFGREGMQEIAIGEWMGASPIYTARMQRLLGFEGDTVETIFKGMQLDIGAPPEFLDFRYTVIDDHHGTFHLDHCGALMDVEPMGDEFVTGMCHDIEDPTFDATAAATNPRAQVRPVHRPPRTPVDRTPHCGWTVTIDPAAEPLPFPAPAARLAASAAATLPLPTPEPSLATTDGWADYRGPLDPDLVMERFSSATLAALADEICLQGHLLSRSYLLQVDRRLPRDETVAMGTKQATGIAGVVSKRLRRALDAPPDLDGLARVLEVHPLLLPHGYVSRTVVRRTDDDGLELRIYDSPGTSEADGLTWPALLVGENGDAIVEAAVTCALPTARIERSQTHGDALACWHLTDHPGGPAAPTPDEVTLTEFSTGADFTFTRRG